MAGVKIEFTQRGHFDSFSILRSLEPMDDIENLPDPIVEGIKKMYYFDDTVETGLTYYYRVVTIRGSERLVSEQSQVTALPSNRIQGGEIERLFIDGAYYNIHTFTESDQMIVLSVSNTIDMCLVGGGGSGGLFGGGGGGGGGVGIVRDFIPAIGTYEIEIAGSTGNKTSIGEGIQGGESRLYDPDNNLIMRSTGGEGGLSGSGGKSGGASGASFFMGSEIATSVGRGSGGSINGGSGAGGKADSSGGGVGVNPEGFGLVAYYYGAGGGAGTQGIYTSEIRPSNGGISGGGRGRNGQNGSEYSSGGQPNTGSGGGGSWGSGLPSGASNDGSSGVFKIRYRA